MQTCYDSRHCANSLTDTFQVTIVDADVFHVLQWTEKKQFGKILEEQNPVIYMKGMLLRAIGTISIWGMHAISAFQDLCLQ